MAHEATEIVVPALQVPVLSELELVSNEGTVPSTAAAITVEVEAVPEVVIMPLHRVPQLPTVVVFV